MYRPERLSVHKPSPAKRLCFQHFSTSPFALVEGKDSNPEAVWSVEVTGRKGEAGRATSCWWAESHSH